MIQKLMILSAFLLLAACSGRGFEAGPFDRPHQWSPEVVSRMGRLPIQEGGRIKPLSTFASYTLYMVHGRRDMKVAVAAGDGGEPLKLALTPTEWLLDVLVYPQLAADYPLFRVENVDVLDAIGVPNRGQRFDFDYVSYRQMLRPGEDGRSPGQRLMELADRYRAIAPLERSPVEAHIVGSAEQLAAYHNLHQSLELLRDSELPVEGELLAEIFPGKSTVNLVDLIASGRDFLQKLRDYQGSEQADKLGNAQSIASVLADFVRAGDRGPAWFPAAGLPAEGGNETWLGLANLVEAGQVGTASEAQVGMVSRLYEGLVAAEHADREAALTAFADAVSTRALARGEYDKVELEDEYYAKSWHYQALHWFLMALLVVAIGWALPRNRWIWILGLALTALPLGFLSWDITLRCLIRDRPPIVNLYDTFLFIAAVGVASALVAEIVTRRRIAISLAPMFGALLIMLARTFEVEDGKDQMAPLQAVLDTNYYLATHVTTINMGYAAGMLAAFLGTAWLLLNAFGFRRNDAVFHKQIVRATYGVTAFGLVFSVFGTIYGGVWANDSWGRFWGWDPKENGALMICLAMVALLHARMIGWVRDLGFCVCAGLTGIVVAFSWFHVNLLGIGLHSYGFSGSTKRALWIYYGIQAVLVALPALVILARRSAASSSVAAPAPERA
jgi:ABC-type transport system involved in cytochrome c biogenesis permease subunit